MKREGRQHGMVRTYPVPHSPWNPTPRHCHVNAVVTPPTAGSFFRVSGKPTNHSKFTGKCGKVRCSDCHAHPAGKSKNKTKGALKPGRVVGSGPGSEFSGFSATGVLDNLVGVDYIEDQEFFEEEEEEEESYGSDHAQSGLVLDSGRVDQECYDGMSFCDVLEQEDEDDFDGWFFVEDNVM